MTRSFPRHNETRFETPLGVAIVGCVGLVAGIMVFWIPQTWLLLGMVVVAATALWFAALRLGRDFELMFLGLFAIGYFQGLVTKLTGEAIPQVLWGLTKFGLLGVMLLGLVLQAGMARQVNVNQAMRVWLVCWLLNGFVIGSMMLEAIQASPEYSPLTTFQVFGIGNMVAAAIAYFRAQPRHINSSLRLFVWAGLLAAMFGVVQRWMGPGRLAALGLNLEGGFFFLNADIPETGFLDLENGLRAFSFFDTHHAFSAFLILSTIALQILRVQKKIKLFHYAVSMLALWAGFAVTFNLTNMLTCLLALAIFAALENSERARSLSGMLLSKRLWQRAVILLASSALVIASVEPLRNRLVSVFDVRQGAAGAGGSLAYRLEGITSGVQAVIDYPLGFGLYLYSTNAQILGVDSYARVNGYFESRQVFFSSDNWFQWLMVQLGLPGFVLYLGLFLIPLIWGYSSRRGIQSRELRILANGLIALVAAVIVAGVSNAPILAFPPSNLLIWFAAGVLMVLSRWDAGMQQGP